MDIPYVNLDEKVSTAPFVPGNGFPLFLQPNRNALRDDRVAALRWFRSNTESILNLLTDTGAIVFRGFAVHDTAAFGDWIAEFESPQHGYSGGATPRDQLAPKVFESTRVPSNEVLPLHQEMAYLPAYPKMLAFYCRMPAVTGGETLVANMRHVMADIEPAFVAEVDQRKLIYHRNFRDKAVVMGNATIDSIHRPWQEAFATSDRALALASAQALGLEAEWLGDGSLATRCRTSGIVSHPRTGERIWFSQLANQTIRRENWGELAVLVENYYGGDRPLPFDVTYGDGTPVPRNQLAKVDAAYRNHCVAFPWSQGDVLLLDNYLAAHGRNAFTGLRDIQVGLLD